MSTELVRQVGKRKGWRLLLWVLGMVALLVASAAVYDTYASGRVLARYPAPGQFVTVNGARMHYICEGVGEPTLVLQAGFGGGALDWSPIMAPLAETNRVCAFDRLGQDYSDPAPAPHPFAAAADELHLALDQLGIQNPVVVGHSLGGALVQIYAAKYEVTGVILVDGLTAADVDTVVKRLGSYQSLNSLGRLGLLRPVGGLMVNSSYPPVIKKQMKALRSGSGALLALTAEGAAAASAAGTDLRTAEGKITAPMLLIGAGQSDVPGLPVGAFSASLKALAERRPNATFVEIAGARHYVQAEQPTRVASAITEWLNQLR